MTPREEGGTISAADSIVCTSVESASNDTRPPPPSSSVCLEMSKRCQSDTCGTLVGTRGLLLNSWRGSLHSPASQRGNGPHLPPPPDFSICGQACRPVYVTRAHHPCPHQDLYMPLLLDLGLLGVLLSIFLATAMLYPGHGLLSPRHPPTVRTGTIIHQLWGPALSSTGCGYLVGNRSVGTATVIHRLSVPALPLLALSCIHAASIL